MEGSPLLLVKRPDGAQRHQPCARPHPGPLPRGGRCFWTRVETGTRCEDSRRFPVVGRKSRAWRKQNGGVRCSLSPGERAGVRAGVPPFHAPSTRSHSTENNEELDGARRSAFSRAARDKLKFGLQPRRPRPGVGVQAL